MDDITRINTETCLLDQFETRREWLVGVFGGSFCYGLILWLC